MGRAREFSFLEVCVRPGVISPMITYDIKNLPALGFQSNAGDLGRRRSGLTLRTLRHVRTTPVARWNIARTPVHFDILGPGAPMRRALGIGAAEEGRQETFRFIISYWEGARLMRNCLCPCPALSDASDTFEHTYHVYAGRARVMVVVVNGRGTGASCIPVPSRSQLSATLLSRASPLCFFVRAKIINGQTEVRYPEVSASWQWRSSHLESPPSLSFSFHFSPRLRMSTVRYHEWLRLTPWVIAAETALWHDL